MTISTLSILKKIYASSALRSFMSQSSDAMPPVLTPDNSAALKSLVNDAISHIVIELTPRISSATPDGDLIELECHSAGNLPLVNAIESAAAAHVLSTVFNDCDSNYAAQQHESASKTIASVMRAFDNIDIAGDSAGHRIKGHLF